MWDLDLPDIVAGTDARIERLTAALSGRPITAAWLFGSQATGETGALSDLDLAVLPDATVKDDERLDMQGRLSLVAGEAWGIDQVDVVFVDEAPPSLAFAAIQGTLILDRDPERRILAEARIQSHFHDRRFYEDRWARATRERWKVGDFA